MSQGMDHLEVRAVRGALSRAAFARLLGVTSLTVLRWELPPDNKEARRPRAKMVEELRRLAAEGVAARAVVVEADDEEDADVSEPVLPEPDGGIGLASSEEQRADERLLGPLMQGIVGEQWQAAADELLQVAASGALRSSEGQALAALCLAQVQLLGRLDVRGALTTLLPVLAQAERGALSRRASARAHVLAAALFGAPDCRIFDLGRINAHATQAEALLEPHEDDLRVLLVAARIAGARSLGPERVRAAYEAGHGALERASSPVMRALASGMRVNPAERFGTDANPVGAATEGLSLVEELGLGPLSMALLADRAWRTLRGATTPDDVLRVTRYARERARAQNVPPIEALLRIFACEIEALTRAGRFEEAHALVAEAEQLAKRGGLLRHALAMPVGRLLVYTNRVAQLEAWADSLETDAVGSQRGVAGIHAVMVRGLLAGLRSELAKADELLHQVCAAPETTPGIDYVSHDAYFELVVVKLLSGDRQGARAWLRRAYAYNEAFPSVWHGTLFQRAEALVLVAEGQHAEARNKVETVRATCELLGDVVQRAFANAGLAMIARASGAPDAEQRLQEVLTELSGLGVWAPELLRRSQALSVPASRQAFRAETLTERLVGAVDRLRVRGLSGEQYRRGLSVILGELFPGREVFVGGAPPADATVAEVGVGESLLRFGVKGRLAADEQAALHILRFFLPRALASSVTSEQPIELDAVLPQLIAVSPPMRRLKGEIACLARSNATILIGGESGTGKEVVARALHDLSARSRGPYIVFNCASVPRDLFESQLFGHRKGAFTGASSDSLGVIRAADGGTLFLDEIGELPLDTQPKLLRFLENAEVLPVGEQRARRVDVRVLAATHRDLEQLVRSGRFREDLYYRLNVVPVAVPPLRERPEDVVALTRLFVQRLTPEGSQAPELGGDAVLALKAHSWPGNVRELRNVVERAMAYAPLPLVLHADHLRIQTHHPSGG